MFPLNHGDELCFKISSDSNPHQQHKIPQDLILQPPASTSITYQMGELMPIICRDHTSDGHDGNSKTKKMVHRDVERQRRQEMATLYSSLRSLLPPELIKGKRSISDHANEAVNYIKYLQKKMEELGRKRDELKGLSSLGDGLSSSSVMVRQCLGGVEIILVTGLGEQGFPLSRVLRLLLEEGISVVNSVSTQVNQRQVHTIQAKVKDPTCFNPSSLEQKLILLVFS